MKTLADVYVNIRANTKTLGPDIKKKIEKDAGAAGTSAGRAFSDGMGKESKDRAGKAGEESGKKHKQGFLSGMSGIGKAMAASFVVGAGVSLFGGMISEAREAEKMARMTEAAIKATGGAANVSAGDVAKLSDAISNKVGVDDEVIQSGANLLLTFKDIKNVGNEKIFDQATASATDMAAAMNGGVVTQENLKTSSIQIGKALNDPLKGMKALSRVGVTFTDQQREQIKAMVESGDKMGAQKIILQELNSEFGGAAAAAADPAQRAQVAWENFKETMGTAVLPVLVRVAEFFTGTILPGIAGFVKGITDGTSGAGGFVGVMERLGVQAVGVFDWIKANAVPVIISMGQVFLDAGQQVLSMVGWLREHEGIAKALVIGIGALVAATYAHNAAMAVQSAGGMLQFLKSYLASTTLVKAATSAWAAVQWVLNAAMSANPIGIIILAVVALVAALVFAWQNSATFRNIVIGAWEGIKAAVAAVVGWFMTTALPFLQQVWATIAAGALLLYQNVIKPAFEGWKIVMAAVFGWIINTGWPALQTVLGVIGTVIRNVYNGVVKPAFDGWRLTIQAVFGWIMNTGWPALQTVLGVIGTVIRNVYNGAVKPAFDSWRATIAFAWGWITNTGWPALRTVFDTIVTAVRILYNAAKKSFDGWRAVIEDVWGWVRNTALPFIRRVFDDIKLAVSIWVDVFRERFDQVKSKVEDVWGWIRNTAWPFLKGVFEDVKLAVSIWAEFFREKFDQVKGKVEGVVGYFMNTVVPNLREAFDSVKTFVTDLYNGFRDKFDLIRDKVTTILDGVKKAFETTKDAIKTTWEKIQEAVRTPINYVINPVYAKIRDFWNAIAGKVPGLGTLDPIAQMATGGVLPGYTPGRDVMYAHVSGGEAIMRPEFTRGVGKGWVDHWNSVARSGGVGAVRRQFAGGFADGGIIGDIKGFFGKAKDFVLGNLLKVAEPVIGGIRGLINSVPSKGGKVGEMAKAIPNKLLDAAIGLLKSKDIAPVTSGGLWAGGGIPGIMSFLKAQDRKPYIWASAGPTGYDCSGIVSAVWNLVMGRNPHNHTFSTHTQASYFTDPPGGLFEAGWSNAGERGGGAVGHTSAIFNGLPFEAGGNNGNVSVGRSGITPVTAFAHRGSMPKAAELIKAHLVRAFETPRGGVVSGTVMGWIREALSREGVPDWQAWMETLVKRESNGNRFARSFSSNGPLGYAIGLAQLLSSTFAFFRDRSLPNDRTDPIANLVASIRYIKSRYGSIFNVGHANPNGSADPGGYAGGGIVGRFDKGGLVPPGGWMYNGGRKPELAIPTDTPVRLHPKDLAKLGEIIGSHVARAIGMFGSATARNADLIVRS